MVERKSILIVDDTTLNREYAKNILDEGGYDVITAKSGMECLDILKSGNNCPDLVLLDLIMPEMDGYETMRGIRRLKCNAPIIYLTADTSSDSEIEGFRLGADDFIRKPYVPQIMLERVSRTIEYNMLKRKLESLVSEQAEEIRQFSLRAFTLVAIMIDGKNRRSQGQSIRVALISKEIAIRLGWQEEEIDMVYQGALLHNIGKIAIPEHILMKPGNLTREEHKELQTHVMIGRDLLSGLKGMDELAEVAGYHHEYYDGSGYPEGLVGDDIPIMARIVSIAKTYDGMSVKRADRLNMSQDEIKEDLIRNKGKKFDPKLVDIVISMMEDGFVPDEGVVSYGDSDDKISKSTDLLYQVYNANNKQTMITIGRDSLTNLWNRRFFEIEVVHFLEEVDTNGIFFMVDIDNFKKINDTYGHMIGDDVLNVFARCWLEGLPANAVAGRIGGDEFVAYIPGDIDSIELGDRLRGIMDSFAEAKSTMDVNNYCSISIGIAYRDSRDSYESMYHKSDEALYYAKRHGKNNFVFYDVLEKSMRPYKLAIYNQLQVIAEAINLRSNGDSVDASILDRVTEISSFIEDIRKKGAEVATMFYFFLFDLCKEEFESDNILKNINDSLVNLDNVLEKGLRGSEKVIRYKTGRIVIMQGLNEDAKKAVGLRIMDTYYKTRGTKSLDIIYDCIDVEYDSKS